MCQKLRRPWCWVSAQQLHEFLCLLCSRRAGVFWHVHLHVTALRCMLDCQRTAQTTRGIHVAVTAVHNLITNHNTCAGDSLLCTNPMTHHTTYARDSPRCPTSDFQPPCMCRRASPRHGIRCVGVSAWPWRARCWVATAWWRTSMWQRWVVLQLCAGWRWCGGRLPCGKGAWSICCCVLAGIVCGVAMVYNCWVATAWRQISMWQRWVVLYLCAAWFSCYSLCFVLDKTSIG